MKILKYLLIGIISVLCLVYLAFLFVLPYAVDINKFAPQIAQEVEKSSGFKITTKNIKLSTGWNLSMGAKVGQVDLMYPTSEKFAQVKNLEVKLSLLPLLARKITFDDVMADSAILHLGVEKNGKFTIEKYLKKQVENTGAMPFGLEFSDNMPTVGLKKYSVAFVDTTNGKKYSIKGENLKVSDFYLNKKIKVKANGEIDLDGRKQVTYDINLLNKKFADATATSTSKSLAVNVIDIFKNLYMYNVRANLNMDLKIDKDGDMHGGFDVDKVSLVLSGKRFPQSNLSAKFDGKKIKFNSNLYTDLTDKAVIKGVLSATKNPYVDLTVNSEKTDLANTFLIANTIFELLGNNSLKGIKADGHLAANFKVKSDFKTVQSSGYLKVNDARILYSLYSIALNHINADVDFSNNKVNVKELNAQLNGAPITVKGEIDKFANANLQVWANKLPVKGVLAAAGQTQLLKENNFQSGLLTLNASLKGKLNTAIPQVSVIVDNLALKNKPSKAVIKVFQAKAVLKTVSTKDKKFAGDITAQNIKVNANPIYISAPKAEISFNEKDLTLKNSPIYLSNSKINVYGKITDFMTDKLKINITAKGLFVAKDIRALLPYNIRRDVKAFGKVPMVVKVSGDAKVQDIYAQVLANNSNHVSIIDISSLKGKTSLINADLRMIGNDLRIDDISMSSFSVSKGLTDDFKRNISGATKIAAVKGVIGSATSSSPRLNDVNVLIPTQIGVSIPGFSGSSVQVKGDVTLNGVAYKPSISGSFSVPSVSLPSIATYLKGVGIHFGKNSFNLNCNNLKIADSMMAFNAVVDNNFAGGIKVKNVDYLASYIDLDSLSAAFSKLPQSNIGPGVDLGVTINDGKGTVTKFKTGGIVADNIVADFDLHKNILTMKNLFGEAYAGKIAGKVTYNLVYGTVGLDLQGRGLSASPAIKGLTGLNNLMTGKADFDANLKMRGATQDDLMRSLKGNAVFVVSDGKMGTLGKLEHLLYAQNILSNSLLKTSLNVIAKAVTVKNTGSFKYIKGKMTFVNGWANIAPIQMSGPSMSMYVTGKFNILNNSANLTVLGRLSNDVVQVLGPIGEFSMDKLLAYIPKLGNITAGIVNQMTTSPQGENIALIPTLTPQTTLPTKEFKAVINGGIESQSSVKYFKWLAEPTVQQTQNQSAEELKNKVNDVKENVKNTIQQYVPSVQTQPQTTNFQQNSVNTIQRAVPDFINKLPNLK